MRGKQLFLAIVVMLLSTSCGQVSEKPVKPNNLPDLVTDHIITPYDHYYPGSTVEVSVKLSMAPKEIWFGVNNKLVKSKNTPIDGLWTDNIALTEKFKGSKDIAVTYVTEDWVRKTINKTITIVDKPEINIEQKRSSNSSDKIIVWADVKLTKVEFIKPDGKVIPMLEKDKKYELETKLPQPGQLAGTVKTTDILGAVFQKQIKTSDNTLPKFYYIDRESGKFDEVARVWRQIVSESPFDFTYRKTAFEIILKQAKDEDLERLAKITKDTMFSPDWVGRTWVKALSKDRKWAIITTLNGATVEDNVVENGKLLKMIRVIFTYLYNTQTREQKLIGRRLIKNYTGYTCESGSVFFPVLIEDDDILMIEQVKDGRFHKITTKGWDPHNDYRTSEAMARGVTLSLKDLQIRPSDKVKPLSPWVNLAFQGTGYIQYAELYKDCLECGSFMPDGYESLGEGFCLSNLSGDRVMKYSDLNKLCEHFTDDKYTKYNGCGITKMFEENGKTVLYISPEFEHPIKSQGEREGPNAFIPRITKIKYFKYTLETKELVPITPKYRDSNNQEFELNFYYVTNCIIGLKYPLFFASYGANESSGVCAFYLKNGEFVKVSEKISINGFAFILPGGEQ